jgi:hypothetical protein
VRRTRPRQQVKVPKVGGGAIVRLAERRGDRRNDRAAETPVPSRTD